MTGDRGAEPKAVHPGRDEAAAARPDPPWRWSEYESRVLSARHVARLEARIVELASGFWRGAIGADRSAVEAAAEAFFVLYPGRPISDNAGGSGYSDCFWIYAAARLLAPRLIVESGVYKGQVSWLLRRACPEARIHCFDVDLGQRVYRDGSLDYHEGDWTEVALAGVEPESSLCLFDDHVNHARRVREAHERGFRTLLFDDDLTADTLYATGCPPVPTIAMLFDETLRPGERIEWLRHGKPRHYVFDPVDTFGARDLIATRHVTPDLTPIVRHRPQGGLTLVRLVA